MITLRTNSKSIPFIYAVAQTLSANGLGSVNLTLAADSWFELTRFVAATNDANFDTDQNPNAFSVQVTDQGTGRQLSNLKIQQALITGTTYRHANQRYGIVFSPNTTIQFDFQNLTGNSLSIQLGMEGYKYYGQPPIS